jgi:hypothetical protein
MLYLHNTAAPAPHPRFPPPPPSGCLAAHSIADSSITSCAAVGLSAAVRAQQRCMMPLSLASQVGGMGSVPLAIAAKICGKPPLEAQGTSPVTISHSTTPKLQMSEGGCAKWGLSSLGPSRFSGEHHTTVPLISPPLAVLVLRIRLCVPGRALSTLEARPKS